MIYEVCKFLSFWFLKIFFRTEVKGKDAFPADRPFILASNHISNIDPFAVGSACPYPLMYLAKEELFSNKFCGAFLEKLNALPLQRSKSDLKTMRMALNVLKTKPLLIFPQGTRTQDLDAFKSGVGFLSKKAQVPVIVAKIEGSDKILPRGAKFFKAGRLKITYANVDTILESDSYEEIAAKVVQKIKSL